MKRRSFLALVGACGMAAAACAPSEPPPPKNRLVVGASARPTTLDPLATTENAVSQALLYNVYEPLMKLDADGRIRPLLAESWSVSSNGLTYTFVLKDGLKFATGNTIDADSVVASIERVRFSSQVSPAIREQMAIISKVVEVDPQTVTVTLLRPSKTWLRDMTQIAGAIIDPGGGERANSTAGSGPYQLRDFDGYLTLERNPNYWGEQPAFDAVIWRYIADAAMKNNAVTAGELDIDAEADPGHTPPAGFQVIHQLTDDGHTKTVVAKSDITGIPTGAYGAGFDLTHVRRQ